MSLMICSEGVFAVPDFCLIFAPRLATMSQKSSFPHPADSVQYVLTSNSPKRPRGFRCQSVPLSKTVPRLVATHQVPIGVGGAIGNCATSSLLHLPIGNAVTGGDQRLKIENRGQPLPMLLHLGPQLLQRFLPIARF